MYTTPRKRINDENAHTPTPLRTPTSSFRFRLPLQPLQPTPSSQNTTPVKPSSFQGFVDGFTPVPKRRRTSTPLSTRVDRERKEEERKEEESREALVQQQRAHTQLDGVLTHITNSGYPTLHAFLDALFKTKDPARSSQVSRMLAHHGFSLLESIRDRQPKIANDWAISTTREIARLEIEALSKHFCPTRGSSVMDILSVFSVNRLLSDAEVIAPTIYDILRHVGFPRVSEDQGFKYKKHELILVTIICLLTKSRSEHATEFQTTMCMYLLACGTSKSLFNVLNHAGLTLSYSQAVEKLKKLGQERLALVQTIAHTLAVMLAYDNFNVAFKVSEQRHDSKDHFDNGTTATLIPLFGVKPGDLETSLKPKRVYRNPTLSFNSSDLLPSKEEVTRVQAGQLWHIEDILYDAFPDLRHRLASTIPPPPEVHQIPLHKTEQYPLPAMHIDESTLEGTLNVVSTIFRKSLGLTEEDVRRHGLFICAGDQLSLSLLDKASSSRRDDTDFLDNIGLYTEGQEGLLHVKFAHARMIANEYWGKPNARSPWSLWKVNTLLGRKAISAGWKAKSPPPFRPVYELMLNLTLPANILDGFRIYCPKDKLQTWVDGIKTIDDVRQVSQQVLDQLCSGRRVQQLRQLPARKRDVPLENIILFNRDALHLRQLRYAIRRGDVGVVLDICTHLMLAFRGTGKTPKYADAIFSMIIRLKNMDSKLRNAWLNNWLVNLSGKVNGFKEVDLLQEHQNFWLKDEDTRLHAEFDDLLLDHEEYPIGSNGDDYVAAIREIVTELSNS